MKNNNKNNSKNNNRNKINKKVIILTAVFIASFSKVNAANFVIGFTGQFGASASITEKGKYFSSDFRDFETAFSIQPGVFFYYYADISSALFLDIGYAKDSYELKHDINDSRIIENFNLNNISIGLLPRINFKFLSIGVGGGIKLPISMTYLRDDEYYKNKLDLGDIRDTLTEAYYPYIKASVDFLIKGQNRFMMSIGVYANYDFAFNLKKDGILQNAVSKENIASFDIGFQLGMYFVSL